MPNLLLPWSFLVFNVGSSFDKNGEELRFPFTLFLSCCLNHKNMIYVLDVMVLHRLWSLSY